MDLIKIKDENGLEITVSNGHHDNGDIIPGGMDTRPTWEEYLSEYKDEFIPHIKLIRKAIEDLGWVGENGSRKANSTWFVFSDDIKIMFTWRSWGDLMSAIVGRREGYVVYCF